MIAAQYPDRARCRRGLVPVPRAAITVAPLPDGRWCWGYSWMTTLGGHGFAALPKWGYFAPTREQALRDAAQAMRADIEQRRRQHGADFPFAPLLAWLDKLTAPAQQSLFEDAA